MVTAPNTCPVVKVYTDGSFHTATKTGSWVSLLQCGAHKLMICDRVTADDNNRVELEAAVQALQILHEPCNVEITSDSRYVVDGVNTHLGNWRQNQWRNSINVPIKHRDLWETMAKHLDTHTVTATWVKAHNGHKENSICDRIARSLSRLPS